MRCFRSSWACFHCTIHMRCVPHFVYSHVRLLPEIGLVVFIFKRFALQFANNCICFVIELAKLCHFLRYENNQCSTYRIPNSRKLQQNCVSKMVSLWFNQTYNHFVPFSLMTIFDVFFFIFCSNNNELCAWETDCDILYLEYFCDRQQEVNNECFLFPIICKQSQFWV